MAIDQKLINEINALAHKKKTVGLTPEEQAQESKEIDQLTTYTHGQKIAGEQNNG